MKESKKRQTCRKYANHSGTHTAIYQAHAVIQNVFLFQKLKPIASFTG